MKPQVGETGGAESGALEGRSGPEASLADPDLQALVRAWPGLGETVRAGILAMVRTGGGGRGMRDAGNSDTHVGGAQTGGAS